MATIIGSRVFDCTVGEGRLGVRVFYYHEKVLNTNTVIYYLSPT